MVWMRHRRRDTFSKEKDLRKAKERKKKEEMNEKRLCVEEGCD